MSLWNTVQDRINLIQRFVVLMMILPKSKCVPSNLGQEDIVDSKDFQSAPEVSFSIILPDANGHNKEIKYDGPLEGIEKVGDIIKSMNDEATQRDTTFIE